jgi:4'-phosphopantetheinyl transferase
MNGVFWLEQTLDDLPESNNWLTSNEAARLAKLRFTKRRADWRLGRWTAKQAIATYLGLPSGPPDLLQIEIRPAPSGAPEVYLRDQPAPVEISLSHRDGTGLCAITQPGTPLGCDLEFVEARPHNFVQEYFTEEEQNLVLLTPPAERPHLVTALWSAKESVLKGLRVGLRASTKSVSICPLSTGGLRWGTFYADTSTWQRFDGWWREAHCLVRTVAVLRGSQA